MLADLLPKSRQGTLFEILRRVVMVWDHISLLNTDSMSELKEHVENDQNWVFNPKMDLSPNQTWTYTEALTGD